MTTYCRLSVLILAFVSVGFGQDVPSAKSYILPKEAVEVASSGVGGTFAMLSEEGKIYSANGKCEMQANVNSYGDKATLAMYVGGASDFQKAMRAAYDDDQVKKSKCCFKVESYGGGTLASWTGKVLAVDEDVQAKYDQVHLSWKGIIGYSIVYLNVTLDGSDAKARSYLSDMIAKAKGVDFTKIQ